MGIYQEILNELYEDRVLSFIAKPNYTITTIFAFMWMLNVLLLLCSLYSALGNLKKNKPTLKDVPDHSMDGKKKIENEQGDCVEKSIDSGVIFEKKLELDCRAKSSVGMITHIITNIPPRTKNNHLRRLEVAGEPAQI